MTSARKVSSRKICELYQTKDSDLLYEVASLLDELAQGIPTFDQDDHSEGKDAGKFHWAYLEACRGEYPGWLGYRSAAEYLFREIDVLMAGCHADSSPADYYIEGGKKLLGAIFEWDGKGNLYQFYLQAT